MKPATPAQPTMREELRTILKTSPGLPSFFALSFLATLNSGLLVPVLPLFFFSRGLSVLQLGSLFSLIALCSILVMLLAGRHASFFARRGVLTFFLFTSTVAFPLYLWVETIPQFALVAAASAVSAAAAGPGLQVFLADLSAPARRATIFGYFGTLRSFAYAAGVILGGSLLASGFPAVFYGGTAISLTSFLLLTHLLGRSDRQTSLAPSKRWSRRPSTKDTALHAIRSARADLLRWNSKLSRARLALHAQIPVPVQSNRNVAYASLYLAIFGASLAFFPVYFPQHLLQLGLPLPWVGAVVASSWITFGLAQPLAGRYADRTGRHQTITVSSLAIAAALCMIMATASLVWVVLAWTLLGVADGLGRPLTGALLASHVAPSSRGSVYGWTMAGDALGRVTAPFLLALIIIADDLQTGLVWVSAFMALSILPLLMIRPLPTPASSQPARTPQGAQSA